MLYLVIGHAEDINGPLLANDKYFPQITNLIETVFNPSFEIMAKWEREGRIKAGGNFAGERAGCAIIEASSHDELANILGQLPMWGMIKWEIKPIQSFKDVVDMNKRQIDNFKNMMNKR